VHWRLLERRVELFDGSELAYDQILAGLLSGTSACSNSDYLIGFQGAYKVDSADLELNRQIEQKL